MRPHWRRIAVVRWIFAQRLAGHSVARIARALNDADVPCPSAADPGQLGLASKIGLDGQPDIRQAD
jgi:hypothetical protein